jgi:hypothetical protein
VFWLKRYPEPKIDHTQIKEKVKTKKIPSVFEPVFLSEKLKFS